MDRRCLSLAKAAWIAGGFLQQKQHGSPVAFFNKGSRMATGFFIDGGRLSWPVQGASGKSPYGHGRLFVNSRYSPDCG